MADMTRIYQWTDELAAKGRKPKTISTYRECSKIAFDSLERAGMSTDPRDIDADTIRQLKRIRSDMTQSSLRICLWTIGAYVQWETGRNPYREADILWGSDDCPNRVYVERDDLGEADRYADPATHTILVLGSCMGLRRSEISHLKVSDIRGDRLRIVGKGHGDGKIVTMQMPRYVIETLEAWMGERRALERSAAVDESDGALLVYVRDGKMRPMTPECIYARVHRLSIRTGIPMTPHSLRRRFATTLYDDGVDLADIKTLMRHESVDTTVTCYIKPNDLRLDSIMDEIRM